MSHQFYCFWVSGKAFPISLSSLSTEGRHSEAAHEKRLLCAQKCTKGELGWGGVRWVGHEGVGWGRVWWVVHEGVGWGGVCHIGVG